jgi:hypothetical protein
MGYGRGGEKRTLTGADVADAAVAVTPHDSTNFAAGECRGLYVGVAGDITAIINGVAVLFKGVPQGSILPVRCTRVNSTATTATDMVALY